MHLLELKTSWWEGQPSPLVPSAELQDRAQSGIQGTEGDVIISSEIEESSSELHKDYVKTNI